MLKHLPSASFGYRTSEEAVGHQYLYLHVGRRSYSWDERDMDLPEDITLEQYHAYVSTMQMQRPFAVCVRRGATYWLFREKVYSTTADLEPAEVQALIEAREQKQRRQVERAKAYVESSASTAQRRDVIPDDVKVFVWQRDKGRCVRCGSNKNLEFDHIIPVIMGGSNTARNIQLLCESCNREKGGHL